MPSVSVRSYLAAGVAAVGVGAVALSPVQPLTADLALAPNAAELAVGLAAAVDPIANLVDTIEATGASLSTLVNNWANGIYVAGSFAGNANNETRGYKTGVPLPIIQQVVQNQLTYLGELPDIGAIAGQLFDNIGNALGAPFAAGENLGVVLKYNQNVSAAAIPGLGGLTPRTVWSLLPVLLNGIQQGLYDQLKPILDFATTPISGLLVGAIGPVVAPVLSVVKSLDDVVTGLRNSDFEGALYSLINAPVNAVGAFLNGGQVLDLTPVVSLLGTELPAGVKIGLQMGGLLSPGGVAFDALSATVPQLLTSPGLPVGPIGALVGLTNYIAKAIAVTPPNANRTGGEAVEQVAAVRAAAATPAPQSAEPAALNVADEGVAEPTAEESEASTPVVTAERGDSTPAPAKRSQDRRSAAAGGDKVSASASTGRDQTSKAAASRRAAR